MRDRRSFPVLFHRSSTLLLWAKVSVFLLLITSKLPGGAAKKKVWRHVEAIDEREAVLPCEVGPIKPGDAIYVVLFYINGKKEPIYSYDNRPRALQSPAQRHIIQSPSLEGRVTYSGGTVPALHIKPVYTNDEANYTCRVDFRIANSRTTHLSLRVAVPPPTPRILIAGRQTYKHTIGPLSEGETMKLSCIVNGGDPPPKVVWLKDNMVLDSKMEETYNTNFLNELVVSSLSRSFYKARLICQAYNNNITAPAETSITVKMNLRPLETRISHPPKVMKFGEFYEISCISAGSWPPANVSWSIGTMGRITHLRSLIDHGDNSSISTTRVKALKRFHNQKLSCTATNSFFPAHTLADSILLNITYPPVAALELGRGVSSSVKEGEDVYFNCMVDSNPPPYRILWFHGMSQLAHSPNDGILISDHSLGLRHVTRNRAGKYICMASNQEGDARSSSVFLHISYAPICSLSKTQSKVLASPLGKSIYVECDIQSSPGRVKYSWVFNNSVTSERVPGNKVFITEDGKSRVHFIAHTPQDYGTLQCWAENSVGRMREPCLYHVHPAGPPDPPENCSVSNKTYVSLMIKCSPGFNGGVSQDFYVEVHEAVTGKSQLNKTSPTSQFILTGLTPGLDYFINIISRNSLGSSKPVKIEAFTYKMAENRIRDQNAASTDYQAVNLEGMAKSSKATYRTLSLLGSSISFLVLVLVAVGLIFRYHIIKKSLNHSCIYNSGEDVMSQVDETVTYVEIVGTGNKQDASHPTIVKMGIQTLGENTL